MKKIVGSGCFLFWVLFVHAQQPDSVIFQVYYSFSHLTDTTLPDKLYKENMLLEVSKNGSLFLSAHKAPSDSKLMLKKCSKTTTTIYKIYYFILQMKKNISNLVATKTYLNKKIKN